MRRHVLPFLLLAYTISWSIYAVAHWGIGVESSVAWMFTGALFMLGPACSALIVRNLAPRITLRAMGITDRGIRWNWVFGGIGLAIVVVPLTMLFNTFFGNLLHLQGFGTTSLSLPMMAQVLGDRLREAGVEPGQAEAKLAMVRNLPIGAAVVLLLALIVGGIVGSTANLPFALGEEIGWRGLLLTCTHRWGLLRHVLFTGVVWGLWHAPLIMSGHNYPDHTWIGVFWMCGLTTVMAVPLAWVRVRSRCIWAAGAMHGTVNATAGAAMLFTKGGSSLFASPAGISGMLAIGVVALALLLFDRSFPHDFRNWRPPSLPPLTEAPSPGS